MNVAEKIWFLIVLILGIGFVVFWMADFREKESRSASSILMVSEEGGETSE